MLGRFTAVVGSMLAMSMRHVSVMTCLLVISTLVMLGGFPMVFRRVLVVFCCLLVMLRAFMFHVGDLCVNLPGIVPPVSPRFRSGKIYVTAARTINPRAGSFPGSHEIAAAADTP